MERPILQKPIRGKGSRNEGARKVLANFQAGTKEQILRTLLTRTEAEKKRNGAGIQEKRGSSKQCNRSQHRLAGKRDQKQNQGPPESRGWEKL